MPHKFSLVIALAILTYGASFIQTLQPPASIICPYGTHMVKGLCKHGKPCDPPTCVKNDFCCGNFVESTGSCDHCSSSCVHVINPTQGNYCNKSWWYLTIICVTIMLGLVLFFVAMCCLCGFLRSSKKSRGEAENPYIQNSPDKTAFNHGQVRTEMQVSQVPTVFRAEQSGFNYSSGGQSLLRGGQINKR